MMNNKLKRLTHILNRLYAGEELRISSLAKELHTSTKTIQRDFKEKLKSQVLVREGNRFKLKSNAQKDIFPLNVLENLAQSIGGIFEDDVYEILDKYRSHSKSFQTPLAKITEKSKEILQLQKAIKTRSEVTLTYKDKNLKIYPLELYVIRHSIFLHAISQNQERFFRLEEISQCRLGRKIRINQREAHQIEKDAERFEEDRRNQRITLFIYPQISPYAQSLQWGENQEIFQDTDGSLIIEFDCVNEEGIISEILSQAPNIIVLEPQNLKERIKRKILTFIKRQYDLNALQS